MPMIWSVEADAKLMCAIIQVCGPPGGVQLQQIATLMGTDCTAKAISHRIQKYRQMAGSLNMEGLPSNVVGLSKVKKAKTSAASKKRGVVKKEKTPDQESEGDDDGMLSPPTTANGKKKKVATVGNKRMASGKMKEEILEDEESIAVGEDVGQGFRSRSDKSWL